MSITRNGNVALSNLGYPDVALSTLRLRLVLCVTACRKSEAHFWDFLEIACWYWPDLARIQAAKLGLGTISLNFK